ncbi:MAG: RcnB family protein [Sphingomonadales bacterium]|nr:RcnB family protein [Sphingomonadales bacterium]
MRKLIIGVLMAATAFPAIASAQTNDDLRRDRRDVREQQQQLDQARRYGDRHDVRREQRDLRDARQNLRDDRNHAWGRDDWRGWRDQNRSLYARGNWNAPFRYQSFRAGVRIAPNYYGQRYWIADPWRYRLPPARPYTRWVRHYNDVLLIDYRRGIVVDVMRNFFW